MEVPPVRTALRSSLSPLEMNRLTSFVDRLRRHRNVADTASHDAAVIVGVRSEDCVKVGLRITGIPVPRLESNGQRHVARQLCTSAAAVAAPPAHRVSGEQDNSVLARSPHHNLEKARPAAVMRESPRPRIHDVRGHLQVGGAHARCVPEEKGAPCRSTLEQPVNGPERDADRGGKSGRSGAVTDTLCALGTPRAVEGVKIALAGRHCRG